MTKEQLEAATQRIAHEWYKGLGIEFAGVELGDCLAYDLLTVLGRIWLQELGNA
jgi:hypothetical protein